MAVEAGLHPRRRWLAWAVGILALQPAAFGQAAAVVVAPTAVRVEVHSDVRDTRFMPLLMQRLARVLAPALQSGRLALDLQTCLPALPGLFPADAQPLLLRLGEGILARGEQATTHVFVVEHDIRLPPARFNFAASFGSPMAPVRLTLVSLARLRHLSADGSDPAPALTAQRVAKLVAKNVARLAGYPGEAGRCLFAFPSSLAELDATPENFCEPDLGVLVQAGVARR
jgi:hypothetical protein